MKHFIHTNECSNINIDYCNKKKNLNAYTHIDIEKYLSHLNCFLNRTADNRSFYIVNNVCGVGRVPFSVFVTNPRAGTIILFKSLFDLTLEAHSRVTAFNAGHYSNFHSGLFLFDSFDVALFFISSLSPSMQTHTYYLVLLAYVLVFLYSFSMS